MEAVILDFEETTDQDISASKKKLKIKRITPIKLRLWLLLNKVKDENGQDIINQLTELNINSLKAVCAL